MGRQTRRDSFVESLTQVTIGYLVALGIQLVVLPHYGCETSTLASAEITGIFTVASLIRGYLVRRAFSKGEK